MTVEDIQNGQVFLIDKPLDWTSFDVVNKIRWNLRKTYQLKKIKVGHAGTLDPKATGLLIVCCGKMTKQIDQIQAQHKTYTGTIKLDATTPTYDLESEEDCQFSTAHLTEEKIHETTKQFIGKIDQVPPLHSAIKKDGKRLYEIARAGETIEIEPRKIEILSFKITRIELPFVDFEVVCSKGTYIRSLAFDFGRSLQVGGYLTALCRTKIGDYALKDADNSVLNLIADTEN
ncbi:tRNA pseudouridine(55) synthase TruB [Weeksella virosa]|uniref:tRNA pseudouridine synthase B n=1 Tax=Weeksella virosa (strain ATCC 43766 / DSM 16922 / JCM 21250 / CCUG 30538 / CDC 9751 / IAM 14551 / NBRC 16016 / NCTC 11634 / CL345/78) TaxID=865938 RepID=F0NZ78_WEEVC|nr:tRNA pseudouridine(55) synthase TruB [Weeksella virosa]ADX67207.1 tRNA pseudouridine synthase B [Weeksella virosa DSM 16922]MDK7375017.1 tRNA pseudouridine(55) synthase TruB [Weeksella virosa]MDK7675944.1 tRNA pseudouridine(55) synthase TruB [Weeksella virosa]SUP53477.1 tRNA pseudouridine synthase B [Weeksella virosa]VEH63056.1 tRNA pseudouridine synthase B [Weeksella virosa]